MQRLPPPQSGDNTRPLPPTHIHVDLVSPLPPSRGHTYLFTIIDRTLRWPWRGHSLLVHHRRRLCQGPLRRLGIPVWSPRHYHIGQGGPVHVRPVGGPLQSAQHPAFAHDSIPSSIKRIGRAVPQATEGRLAVPGHRRRLARPPSMGDAWHQSLIQGGQRVFTGGGRIQLTTDPARPVHQHRRIVVAVFPQQPTDHHGRPPTTADAAQRSASSINTTGGAAAGPLRAGLPGRCAAAAVPGLRRTLPSAGAVNTFLSPRDGRENWQGVHTSPQGGPDTSRYGASQAAAQGSPRCAGATCPLAAADTAGAATTGDLQPSTDSATNNIIHVSIRPPASQRPAAEPTHLWACCRRVWGGGDLWWRTVCSRYVSRLDRHMTYYTSHMLYICTYSP